MIKVIVPPPRPILGRDLIHGPGIDLEASFAFTLADQFAITGHLNAFNADNLVQRAIAGCPKLNEEPGADYD
ncbi:MAG: hypothetical protein ACLSFJ_09935 [Holdemania filiformis]